MHIKTYKVELVAHDLLKQLGRKEWAVQIQTNNGKGAVWPLFLQFRLAPALRQIVSKKAGFNSVVLRPPKKSDYEIKEVPSG